MSKQVRHAISPTRAEDYPGWYQQIIQAADLAENSPVRGCMIIKPWGYAIWENMQRVLDEGFKATGHLNAYFPLLIPLSYLEKEAEHVEGFAKECAVVTHHRLATSADGRLLPEGELDEPLIIRPTSETIIGVQFSKWIQSYRDLPLLINQWANVMRWEMRTRLFLRTSEFLWQEGHTAHAHREEAIEETLHILDQYADFAENTMAMPVIKGEKTAAERFPGADNTYTIEAMMQDYKALQAGTSHFLGQNFAKSFDINFTTQSGAIEPVWTTSWGVSTRLIGGLIMTHSDDDGLILPPKLAPTAIVILPIYRNDGEKSQVLAYCHDLAQALRSQTYVHKPLAVHIDDRDLNGGEKTWQQIKKGVPIRLEIGPRDIKNNSVFMGRRDLSPRDKTSINKETFIQTATSILDDIQSTLFQRALAFRAAHSTNIQSVAEFTEFFTQGEGGFAHCYSTDAPEIQEQLRTLKVTARCIPLEDNLEQQSCIFTGQPAQRIVYAKAY